MSVLLPAFVTKAVRLWHEGGNVLVNDIARAVILEPSLPASVLRLNPPVAIVKPDALA